MKVLTETKIGVLVEFNESEFTQLKLLVNSVEGKTFGETYSGDFKYDNRAYINEFDLSSIFGVIQAFYMEKFRVNEIRHGLEILENSLQRFPK